MKIVKPKVELWKQDEHQQHIARCARVCYATKDGKNDGALVTALKHNKHHSMFRHDSRYFIVPLTYPSAYDLITTLFCKSPYIELEKDKYDLYISTNTNFIIDNETVFNTIFIYEVTPERFAQTEIGLKHMRYTFNVITQISTSRELNRVSPNNIAEQSTRYCNYARGKFEGECAICQPHWFDLGQQEVVYLKYDCGTAYYKIDDGEYHPYANTSIKFNKYQDNPNCNLMFQRYMVDTYSNCVSYLQQIGWGMEPQDARGELPLDLATECCYTYSINEWRHIIDLRYYGTTGKPHPNAKIIAGMIRAILMEEGYDFR